MKHGFLITSHSNSLNMWKAIIALDSPSSVFYIHVDKKVDISANEWIMALSEKANVHFIERLKTNWGGFSHLHAIINLMKAALKDGGIDYFHLLSDSCYPIKPIADIQSFFEANKGHEYLEYEPLPSKTWPFGGLNRIAYYHLHDVINVRKNDVVWNINEYLMQAQMHLGLKRKLDRSWEPFYGGSTWWSLSKDAVRYCIEKIEATPGFYKRYKHTFAFEESCMQTLLLNSPFKNKIVNDNLRYIDWKPRDGAIPANLDRTDYPTLAASDKLFARKFVYPVSKELQEMLERILLPEGKH